MVRVRKGLLVLGLSVFALGVVSSTSWAGTGKVRSNSGKKALDFCVSIRFTATASQLTNIQGAFTAGSAVLADATDGQYEFGKIDLVNSSGASRQAEVWILPGMGRAFATCGLYGTPGEHIVLYYDSNFVSSPSSDGDAYTIAHEFGHHVWGVKDEYSGPSGAGDCEAAPGSSSASFCLMDNYFTRGGNIGTGGMGPYTLNEFCVAGNHDPDGDTFQESKWMRSCWEHIAAHPSRPATAPTNLPVSAAPSSSAPTYRLPVTDRRFVLCLDRSGSMDARDGGTGTPTRLDFAKQAASLFVNLTKTGDRIGVTSFSSSATTNLGLTEITGSAGRNAAKGAINGLSASGSTAIGSGLIASRNLLTSQSTLSCAQTIILLTDGFGNSGPSELSVIPSLIENDISVITIAVGAAPSISNLQQVASQTAGKFFQVATAADLPGLFAALSAESSGGGILARQPGVVNQGEVVEIPIEVDGTSTEIGFVLSWPGVSDNLELSLIAPDGSEITPAEAMADPEIEFLVEGNAEIYVVRNSAVQVGEWKAKIEGVTVIDGTFDLSALSDSEKVALTAVTSMPEFTYPEPVVVMATPRFDGLSIVGARVHGEVVHPLGNRTPIALFDDGDLSHGDDEAGDGVYSTVFSQYSISGMYSFELKAVNVDGMTFEGEELFATIVGSTSRTAPPFVRTTTVGVHVLGVPERVLFDVFEIKKAKAKKDRRGRPNRDKFEFRGDYSLGLTSDGIDPLLEEVHVFFGPYIETLPPGSFERKRNKFEYKAPRGSMGIKKIELKDNGSYKVQGDRVDLSSLDLSSEVRMGLRVGNDEGEKSILFDEKGRFPRR